MSNALTVKQFRDALSDNRTEIAKTLPEHVSIDRFERVTLTAIQQQPDLLQTDGRSLFNAVKSCATDGLIPDGREAALVKFGKSAAYMPMVYGLIKLARQSGEVATLTGRVVYQADRFQYWIDDHGEHLSHTPELLEEPGKPTAVYAMVRTTSGETYIEVMRISEVEKVRKASRTSDRGPWKDWWDQMAIKTAIRRLFKRLPRSTDRLDNAVHRDDQFYTFDAQAVDTGAAPSAAESLEVLTNDEEDAEPEPEPEPEPDDSEPEV